MLYKICVFCGHPFNPLQLYSENRNVTGKIETFMKFFFLCPNTELLHLISVLNKYITIIFGNVQFNVVEI